MTEFYTKYNTDHTLCTSILESTPRPNVAGETKNLPTDLLLDATGKGFDADDDNEDEAFNFMNMLLTTTPAPRITSKPTKSSCVHSKRYRHVTLVGGLQAGNFSRLAEFTNMAECAQRCCAEKSCDVAILMRDTCFALRCSSPELCSARPAQLKNFSLEMIYMYRKGSEGVFGVHLLCTFLAKMVVKHNYLSYSFYS